MIKRAGEILALGQIDGCFSAHRAVDLREQRCGNLHVAYAAQICSGCKPCKIADHTAAELAEFRIGGTDRIPLLAELLQAFPQAYFNIDLKAPGAVAPLVALLRETGAQQRVCVSSFSRARISAFRRLAPEGATGLSRLGVVLLGLGLPGVTRLLRGQAAQVPSRFWRDRIPLVTRRFVRTAHRHGVRVHVWTINDAPAMDALLELGVDGIVTDQPEILRTILEQRGIWEEQQ